MSKRGLTKLALGWCLLSAVALGGCAGGPAVSDQTAAAQFTPFMAQGPYDVGLAALYIGNLQVSMHPGPFARAVDVWYPVQRGRANDPQFAAYDLVSWLPPSISVDSNLMQALFVTTTAHRDAPPDTSQPHPVILYSHATGGFRDEASTLLINLASWGFVVAAPDHPERGFSVELQQAGSQTGIDVLDLEDTLVMLTQENAPGGVFAGAIDIAKVGVIGMAEGSGAAATLAFERGVSAAAFVAGVPPKNQALAPKPTLIVAGSADHIDSLSAAESDFDRLPSVGRLFEAAGAGRQAFTDVCGIAPAEGGAIKVLQVAGVAVPDRLRALYSDGCGGSQASLIATRAAGIAVVTAFFRDTLGGQLPACTPGSSRGIQIETTRLQERCTG
jgi:hypothetical protein